VTSIGASDWDVVVAGAGPGGAAVAHGVARTGASVLLLDRERFPRWKVCGACLSPGALAALEEMGVRDRIATQGPVPLTRLSLAAGPRRATIALRGSAALSRGRLDEALVRAAEAEGASFRDGARARLEGTRDGRMLVRVREGATAETVTARVVVDATGLAGALDRRAPTASGGLGRWARTTSRSGVDAASASASARRRGPAQARSRIGIGATVEDVDYPLPPGELRMVIGANGYVGLVRLEDGRLNVGAAVDSTALRSAGPAEVVARILRQAREPVPSGPATDGWRGTPPLTRTRPTTDGGRVLRLGDAASYVEPFTGEGICWALDAGLAAVDVVGRALSDPAFDLSGAWRARLEAGQARAQRLCRLLARGLRRPSLARSVVGLLGVAPGLASPFVREAARRPWRLGAGTA
jgi:flavin-dependent dehydrogenase